MKKYAILLVAIFLGLASALSYAQAPVPFINLPLMPDATAPGGADFTLTVNGTGFVSNSVVNWNGTALATQFVNQSQLTATVPATDIATASTAFVTVVNPAPNGTSNVAFFTVTGNIGSAVGFGLASTLQTPSEPQSVAVGDFNGDGKLDLVVASGTGNTVSVFLGDGAGNFTLASSTGVGGNPISVAVGDFNKDGKLDLAVAGAAFLDILLGDGSGNFTLGYKGPTDYGFDFVAVGDFNGDGNLDLVTANGYGTNTVSIFLGDGAGNFTLASSPVAGNRPMSVAVGDFNGDGVLDLAVVGDYPALSILLGDGSGNFTLASSLPNRGDSVAVGDFNGDGRLDLVVAGGTMCPVYILLGDGTGNFTLASSPAAGSTPYSVAVGDFNGDGKLDFAAADVNGGTVSVLLQDIPAVSLYPTNLTFGAQLVLTASSPQQVTLENTGGGTLEISSIVASANFAQTNNCRSGLAAGACCTINVIFKPHNINTLTGTITITDNAPNSPQTVPLTGVGTAVTLLPSSLDFGNQPVGTTSQPQTVTLTNYAPKAVTISGGGFGGVYPHDFRVSSKTCGRSLPAGESCTVGIIFAPRSQGAKTAIFGVNDNAGASPQTVSLSGTGT